MTHRVLRLASIYTDSHPHSNFKYMLSARGILLFDGYKLIWHLERKFYYLLRIKSLSKDMQANFNKFSLINNGIFQNFNAGICSIISGDTARLCVLQFESTIKPRPVTDRCVSSSQNAAIHIFAQLTQISSLS